jgi:hypothetical protein
MNTVGVDDHEILMTFLAKLALLTNRVGKLDAKAHIAKT